MQAAGAATATTPFTRIYNPVPIVTGNILALGTDSSRKENTFQKVTQNAYYLPPVIRADDPRTLLDHYQQWLQEKITNGPADGTY